MKEWNTPVVEEIKFSETEYAVKGNENWDSTYVGNNEPGYES